MKKITLNDNEILEIFIALDEHKKELERNINEPIRIGKQTIDAREWMEERIEIVAGCIKKLQ